MMTSKQIKQALMISTALLLVGTLALVVWAVSVSVDVSEPKTDSAELQQAKSSTDDHRRQGVPSLEALQVLGAIDLRRPLRDPPAVVITPAPLTAQLLGTMYEQANPDQSMAMFKMADQSVRWFKAGQTFQDPVGEVTVSVVSDQTVKVVYREQERELVVNRP